MDWIRVANFVCALNSPFFPHASTLSRDGPNHDQQDCTNQYHVSPIFFQPIFFLAKKNENKIYFSRVAS